MVWMWKRILSALGFAHRHGIVHGAVLPPHVLMRPRDHGAHLIDWMGASKEGRATVISAPFAEWYPPEVSEQKRLLPATDIYLAAKCAIYLLGGDPIAESFPETVPALMAAFIKTCLFRIPDRRPQDAWELHAEFDETVVRPLFGAPKFIDFPMGE
jgi:serine/threonine protein kinase